MRLWHREEIEHRRSHGGHRCGNQVGWGERGGILAELSPAKQRSPEADRTAIPPDFHFVIAGRGRG